MDNNEDRMTKPDRPPKPQSTAEREVIRKHRQDRANEFQKIRNRVMPKERTP